MHSKGYDCASAIHENPLKKHEVVKNFDRLQKLRFSAMAVVGGEQLVAGDFK
jgi:hypothetical protein